VTSWTAQDGSAVESHGLLTVANQADSVEPSSDSQKEGVPVRRHGVLTATLLAAALVAARAGDPIAYGATSCGSNIHVFAGRSFNPPGYESHGARANVLRTASPDLCTSGQTTDSSVWVMLAGDGTSDGYAQIGYIYKNYGSDANRFFYEWRKTSGGSFVQVMFGTPVHGDTYDFRASRYDTDGHIHLILDGAQAQCGASDCAETNFDPLTAWSGTNNQWFEETQYQGDDVHGTSGEKTDLNGVNTRAPSGDWVVQTWNGGGTGQCFIHTDEINTNSHFQSWTSPLNHSC
jgi:hypothetical protein